MIDEQPINVYEFSLRGLMSLWAPYWLLAGIAAALTIGLAALAVTRPRSGTLVPAIGCGLATLACLTPVAISFVGRVRRIAIFRDRLVWWGADGQQELAWDAVTNVN